MNKSNKRKITVVLVDRANYGRMWPVMREIQEHPDLELQIICTGTMLLERFGEAVKIVEQDGFRVDGRIYVELEGSVPTTMAKSVGFSVIEFSSEFRRLEPDVVLLIGDRYEAFAAAISAAYQNIPLAHIQGGEVSGSIDESARHAISKLSQFHFPSTQRAAEYLIRMGERPETVFPVGCPCGDSILTMDHAPPAPDIFKSGVGSSLDPSNPYLLVIFHPVTTEYGHEQHDVEELIGALHELNHPTLWLWPNIDAGADHISKSLRIYRELNRDNTWLHLIKNLPPVQFHRVLKNAVCAVGNSSSFIRDSTFMGTPVVLLGDRQLGRETGENLIQSKCEKSDILSLVKQQLSKGRYPVSNLYGDGTASKQIAGHLASLQPYVQKHIHYIYEEGGAA